MVPQVDTLLLKESARYLFNKMSQRNLVAWNSSNGSYNPPCKAPSNCLIFLISFETNRSELNISG